MNIRSFWRDRSVSTKLYVVVGTMAILIAMELLTLRFAMTNLSAVRAFVGGEGLWSKSQKTSLIDLRRYTESRNEKDYQAFRETLEVPLGDHEARMELIKAEPDIAKIFAGFERGKIHHDDIQGLIQLVRRFYWVPHLSRALAIWAEADDLIAVYLQESDSIHRLVQTGASNSEIEARMRKIELLNDDFTRVENDFSYTLGEGSRWLESVLMRVLLALVLTVESTGVFLTITFSRNLTKSLKELSNAAAKVGRGIYSHRIPVRSKDELGQLAESLNAMTREIEVSVGGRKTAERASETKSAFLANMSHEIRTPLAAILGFAEALRDKTLTDEEREQYLGIIDRNGKSLTKVIDDILDLSKVEAGGLVVEMLEFSLPTVLQDVVDLFSGAAAAKQIGLILKIEPSARRAVCSDPTRFRQILTNVVGNAIKFTSRGAVSLSAQVDKVDEREVVRVRVSDSGIGLSKAQAEKLFTPFTQGDGSTTRKYGGTGLGLTLSRSLAQALGGGVALESSESGQGSTFLIEIENQPAPQELKFVPIAKQIEEEKDLSHLRVLVAEDSADNRRLIDMLLLRQGIHAAFATTGREALETALSGPYDMILMDIQMPEMDGFEALSKLRENLFTKPVIALTAHALKEERDRCLAAGFVDHLTKPIDERMLVSSLARFAPNAS
jgi:signal transduction histidine kinase/ActR/RegA family two-component response regulator